MKRQQILEELANRITSRSSCTRPLRVAVDGVDAAGKTTLAGALVQLLEAYGRAVIRASIDGFHRPREERYQRGADSSDGYYLDAFDYPAVRDALLLPLGPGGTRRYRRAIFDFRTDTPLPLRMEEAPKEAILMMDGVFLLRPELNAYWDYRIFVDAPFHVVLERAKQRDTKLFGCAEAVEIRYQQRYLPAQRRYLEEVQPQAHADVVVLNEEPENPTLLINRC